MDFVLFLVIVTFLSAHVKCGDKIPERVCATLFSEVGSEGKTFLLGDFDRSANLRKEYRHSLDGWMKTASISVSDGCTVRMCSDTYFLGNCNAFNVATASSFQPSSVVQSVECICQRVCSCSDINIPNDFYGRGVLGRAYWDDGCDVCNSEYIDLIKGVEIINNITNRIKAFIIPKGCNLLYSNGKTTLAIKGPVYKPNSSKGPFRDLRLSCYDNSSVPMPGETQNNTQLQRLPANFQELYELFRLKNRTSAEPGLWAALKSAENGRSGSNVYVVYVGTYHLYSNGFSVCSVGSIDGHIWECNILVEQPDLGISAELRVIVVPVGWTADQSNDYKLMAMLDKHLASIKDLENAVPNAVIIQDIVPKRYYNGMNSDYYRKLRFVMAMSPLLLDESNPNVIFLLDHYDLTGWNVRQPNQLIKSFEAEIRRWWPFPISTCLATYHGHWAAPHKNGYQRMPNMEYWPLNLEMSLKHICERGGDTLGHAILKAYFQDNRTPRHSVYPKVLKIQADTSTVQKYRDKVIMNGR